MKPFECAPATAEEKLELDRVLERERQARGYQPTRDSVIMPPTGDSNVIPASISQHDIHPAICAKCGNPGKEYIDGVLICPNGRPIGIRCCHNFTRPNNGAAE